jgi:hypothetical protein
MKDIFRSIVRLIRANETYRYLYMSDQTETSTNQNLHESVNKRNVIFSLYKQGFI